MTWVKTKPAPDLERYSRQLVMPEWSEAAQRALAGASVLVVGAGALGSPVALYLAGAGVGRLGIVDADDVELSNLHRQLLHFTPDIGVPKAHSAAAKLGFLNPEVIVEPYQVRLDAGNAAGLVEGNDVIVDCSDSFATRYAVNAACCAARTARTAGRVRCRHARLRDPARPRAGGAARPRGGARARPRRDQRPA